LPGKIYPAVSGAVDLDAQEMENCREMSFHHGDAETRRNTIRKPVDQGE